MELLNSGGRWAYDDYGTHGEPMKFQNEFGGERSGQ